MGVIADKIRRAIFGGEVRDSIADGIEVVEQLREDYDNQVINAGNSNAEIVDARGGQTKLKDRLDNFDEQLEHNVQELRNNYAKKSEINSLANDKADKITVQELDTKVYDNLEALKQAHPEDDGKMYIAGTKWCYHNGNTWVEGGEYQGKVLADGSVLKTHIGDGEIDQKRLKRPWGNIYNPSSITIDLQK